MGGSWEDHFPLIEFAYNNSYQVSIEMASFETADLGPDMVLKTIEKIKLIRQRLLIAQSRQKSYADRLRRSLSFEMDRVHYVFYVSILRKCEPDPSHVLDWVDVDIGEDVSYEEGPVQILDTKQKVLRGKTMQLVKVLWRHHRVEEAT
ncbi:uncharacterized protein LOC132295666 [Cornus florida]|uniref:uncharacterized protein LOC132295666 n=1 Tax=Cornus florida TaxID=4283 RepID=UPI0028A1448D|nr:uncharacterized protein LOC132295666 [Cornus florida]